MFNSFFIFHSNKDQSGQVPSSLASLKMLTYLFLSYNQLSGPLPDLPRMLEGMLNVTGNPGLKKRYRR
jgi:hypothetical protein